MSASSGNTRGLAIRNLVRRSPRFTHLGVRALGRLQALRDRGLSPAARWTRRAPDETRYWAGVLHSPEARTCFLDRLDPQREITGPALRRAVDETMAHEIRILDVGAGPLTAVGTSYPGKRISVVPIDPLADAYVSILRDAGLDPPVLPVPCSGDEIVKKFGAATFDVAFALNALDHSADPLRVLDNMLTAITPGGRVALSHMHNEGERNGYFGIHFWNIDSRDGRFVIWNRRVTHDVTARLADRFETECWAVGDDWVHCLIRPLS